MTQTINQNIGEYIFNNTYEKFLLSNNSGIERNYVFNYHIGISNEYPLLGVGFGSSRTKDLLSTFLCNIGYIGTGFFLLYIFCLVIKLIKHKNYLNITFFSSLIVMIACLLISVPEPYYLYIWLIFAFSEVSFQRQI